MEPAGERPTEVSRAVGSQVIPPPDSYQGCFEVIGMVTNQPSPTGSAFCSKCGSPVPPGSGFCAKCGASIGAPAAAPTGASQFQPQPPKRKSRKLLWIIIGVVVVIVIIVIAALAYVGTNTVKVTGENWTIAYDGSTSGYFGPSPQSFTQSISGTTGDSFTYTLTLTSSAAFLTHNISAITVASPFSLGSVSPSLPISVTPGGSATITLTITMPSSGGSYVLSGTVTTY